MKSIILIKYNNFKIYRQFNKHSENKNAAILKLIANYNVGRNTKKLKLNSNASSLINTFFFFITLKR